MNLVGPLLALCATPWIERLLAIVGVACLTWAGTTWLEARQVQDQQRAVLEGARSVKAATTSHPGLAGAPNAARVRSDAALPIGELKIPRLDVSVVVMPGDDETTLSKAVGHLSDTPLPWETGNSALAGHRDTFFRPLEGVKAGDDIYFETRRGRLHYRVHRVVVVDPEDVWVLNPTADPTLTLITCYPFKYVGPAPKRFIVQARRV